jgi:FkbM family methyltransferase
MDCMMAVPITPSDVRQYHARLLELNGGKWFDFETHIASLYRAVLRSGSVAIDGGANIGAHALQMARAVSPDGLVIAIEPVPELAEQLDCRREEHGISAELIRIMRVGLSDKTGHAEFFQVTGGPQHGLSGLKRRHFLDNYSVRQIAIQLTTLNDVSGALPRLDYVKLDLEGAEILALRGGRETFEKFRPVISIEQDQYSPHYFGYSWQDLLDYFGSIYYEVYDLFCIRYTQAEMFERCAVWDFLAIPFERPEKARIFEAVRKSMEQAGIILA